MEKITVGQFLSFTNRYVPICIEDEFNRYEGRGGSGMSAEELFHCVLTEEEKECPIDYIRNVDGGHFGDNEKRYEESKERRKIVNGSLLETYNICKKEK